MPNIASHNGIDVGNIASINGQDIASGGAFNPVAETGTYTETIPSTGVIKRGGHYVNSISNGRTESQDNIGGFHLGGSPVNNMSSDVDSVLNMAAETLPAGMGTPTKISYGQYQAWIIDDAGKLWRVAHSTSYGGTSSNAGTNTERRTWNQVTGVGDSDTGWTSVSTEDSWTMCINSGKLYGIGANTYGQFGGGNNTASYGAFVQTGSDSDWVSVSTSRYNSQAIKGSSNVLYTAGRNAEGINGNGTTSGNQTTFTAVDATNMVSGTNNNVTLVKGSQNCVGFIQSGRAFGMGKSDSNENMGGNINSDQTIPVQIGKVGGTLQTDWTDVIITDKFSHLINTSGHLYFAGDGNYYVPLDGTTTDEKNDNHRRIGSDSDWQGLKVLSTTNFVTGMVARKNNQLVYAGYETYGRIGGTTSTYVTSATVISTGTVSSNDVWGLADHRNGWLNAFVYYYST